MTELLGFAREQTYAVSSNVRGDEAGLWAFLLPSLEVGRAIVVGGRGGEVGRAARALPIAAEIAPRVSSQLETADIVVVTPHGVGQLLRSPDDVAAVRQALARGSVVVLEASRHTLRVANELLPDCVTLVLAPVSAQAARSFALTCSTLVVPRGPTGFRRRPGQAVRRLLRRTATPPRLLALAEADDKVPPARARRAVAVLRKGAHDPCRLPAYVREAAARGGHVAASERWVLEPSRGYRSQKIVFHLPEADEIVKVTQAPEFNGRLLNEYRALVELDGRAPEGLAPRPLFVGEHGGLLLVGETRLPGVPFRQASTGLATCEVASRVVDTLAKLSRLPGAPYRGAEAAAALTELLEHHLRLNDPSAAAGGALRTAIERIADAPEVPSAFTHGDPTTFNILVDPDGGSIGLVDWENSEPHGLPLWDLLHFLHAYAQWAAERGGARWTPDVIWATMLLDGPFASLLHRSIDRYVRTTGLSPELVEPLIRTFWMGLAIREATRQRRRGSGGTYARLLEDAAARAWPQAPN